MSSTKADLRNLALQRRDAIDDATRQAFAARLAEVGPGLVRRFFSAGERPVASLFHAIGSEPDAMPLATSLHEAGVTLVLPVDWSHGNALVYRRWIPGDRLIVGPLGIAEPLADAPELEPDILFIPLLAFDRRGHRLGYGAGNVDRTLGALRRRKTVRAIGIAYAVQEEATVPNDEHDEPVDLIVTETAILACRD